MTKIAYLRASQNDWTKTFGTADRQNMMPNGQRFMSGAPGGNFPGNPGMMMPQFPTPTNRMLAVNRGQSMAPKPMIMTPTTRFNTNPSVLLGCDQSGGRISKPLMEKRRRARINQCLSQLKTIVVDSAGQYTENNKCKLEKADILELTVKYVKQLHQQQQMTDGNSSSTSATPSQCYVSGYVDCAQQVLDFVSSNDQLDECSKQHLTTHLSNCLDSFSHCEVTGVSSRLLETNTSDPATSTPTTASTSSFSTPPSPAPSSTDSHSSRSSGISCAGSTSPLSPSHLAPVTGHLMSSSHVFPLSDYEEGDYMGEDDDDDDEEYEADEDNDVANNDHCAMRSGQLNGGGSGGGLMSQPLNLTTTVDNGNHSDDEPVWRPW